MSEPSIHTGTSGFSYPEWKGSFYPEKLPAKEMLSYYAERLSTVEINNTFYRMPKREMLEGWADKVPEDFVFVLKASRKITHHARLKEAALEACTPPVEATDSGFPRQPRWQTDEALLEWLAAL